MSYGRTDGHFGQYIVASLLKMIFGQNKYRVVRLKISFTEVQITELALDKSEIKDKLKYLKKVQGCSGRLGENKIFLTCSFQNSIFF